MLRDSQSKPRNVKLDRQAEPPKARLLEQMKQQALSAPGSVIELPFGDDTLTFILTVNRDTRLGNFNWMLYRNDAFSSGLEWSHNTPEVMQIETLVSNSAPAGMLTKRSAAAPIEEKPQADNSQTAKLRKGSLEGDLKNIQMANLLQSVAMGQMTGRLEIIAKSAESATIFFSFGKPVHATMRGAEGHEAVIQIFGWEDGEFTFYDEPVNAKETVTRALTGLMMEGAAFADHLVSLKKSGFSNECYPLRVRNVSSAEWGDILKQGVDCDVEILERVYQRINGTSSWADILRDIPMKKTEWVPVLFSLVNCNLVKLNKSRIIDSNKLNQTANQTDWSITLGIENSLKRADTGLHTYAALLYFMRQEYFRFEEFELPFSLIVFGYSLKVPEGQRPTFIPFHSQAIIELRDRVFKTKKKLDLFCHFGAFSFAILLPTTVKLNARRAVDILAETCSSMSITDEYPAQDIEFRALMANIPEDCNSLEDMLAIVKGIQKAN